MIAGVLLADALAELHLSMLDFALMVERHPDNVTAALIGGFVGSYLRELDDDAQARAQVPLNSNINSNFYFCMSIDTPLISILMSIYMAYLLKITHNLNASK